MSATRPCDKKFYIYSDAVHTHTNQSIVETMIKIISRYETIQDNRDDMQLPSGRCIPNMGFDHMISSAARRRSERAGPSKIRRGNRVKVETVWSFQNRTPRLDNMMQMMLQERQIVHSPRVPYPRDPFWI